MKKFSVKEAVITKTIERIEKKIPDELLFKMWQDRNKWDTNIQSIDIGTFLENIKWFVHENGLPNNCFDSFEKVKWKEYVWSPSVAARAAKLVPHEKPILSINGSISKLDYKSTDWYIYSYTLEDGEEPKWCRYPWKKKLAEYYGSISSDRELFQFRSFLQENPDSGIICFWNITHPSIIPSDIRNLVSVWWHINISGNRFEAALSFPELEYVQECFYYTDISGGENPIQSIKRILPKISSEYIEDKCMELNVIENDFYTDAEIMNDTLAVKMDNHWNPEAFQLFYPLFEGIRPDILWFQDLVQWVKKISSSYLVMLDKRNIPNDGLYIEHRKHLVYLNKVEAVIKIPKWAIKSNNNENYIIITKPQAIWWVPKDILFMDLTRNFPKDMKKVLSIIDNFLNGKLHVSDSYYKAVSKHKLKEPYLLEPTFYI
jgi:hypothetical protein